MPEFTVLAVRRGKKVDGYGNVPFYVDFEGEDGIQVTAYWKRKPENEPLVGQKFRGYLEPSQFDGGDPRFKLEDADAGPRAVHQPDRQSAGDIAPQSSGTGGDPLKERIRWSWSLNLAAMELAHGLDHEQVVQRGLIIRDEATAREQNESVSSPRPAEQAATPRANQGAGKETGSSSAEPEATGRQKATVTRELNTHVPPVLHDELRKAAEAHTNRGASNLIDGLRKFDVPTLLKEYGIAPLSDVPADTDGLEPVGPGLTDDESIPF